MGDCENEGGGIRNHSLDMTKKEAVFFALASYLVRTSGNEKTERTAKEIRAFYEEEKANGVNPDPELYNAYIEALLPRDSKQPASKWKRLKKYALESPDRTEQ